MVPVNDAFVRPVSDVVASAESDVVESDSAVAEPHDDDQRAVDLASIDCNWSDQAVHDHSQRVMFDLDRPFDPAYRSRTAALPLVVLVVLPGTYDLWFDHNAVVLAAVVPAVG